MARLKEIYTKELKPKLKQELACKSDMEIPRITKITINMGLGEALADKKILENAMRDLEQIAGQKPIATKAILLRASRTTAGWRFFLWELPGFVAQDVQLHL